MKLSTLILFLSIAYLSAKEVHSQDAIVNLNITDKSIAEVLKDLEKQTSYLFFYNDKDINVNKVVTGSFINSSVSDVLAGIFSGTDMNYTLFKDYIVLTKSSIADKMTGAQQQKVSGTVTDEKGNPLPGVNVVVTGTTQGVVTDIAGKYSIEVPPGSKSLTFSFIGMEPQEISIGTSTQINIIMVESAIGLDEVVVIGYGTMKKADITGSISKLDADNFIDRPVQRADQAIVGQIAGVRVKQTSGILNNGFSIDIRGTGSITANNEPLYVIDGFPQERMKQNTGGDFPDGNPLDNLNPNDIESIEILKDASAAAIYGSRASNGVVLITTKSGSKGKAKIDFNIKSGWSDVTKKYDVLSTDEWIERAIEMVNAKYLSGGANRSINDDMETRIAKIGSFSDSQIPDPRWFEPGYGTLMPLDWQDALFKTGFMQNYTLSATGGNDFVKYYISGDYLDQEGTSIGLYSKQYSARINLEVQANNKLKFGLNLSPSYSLLNEPNLEGKDNVLFWAISMNPITEEDLGYYVNSFDKGVYSWSKKNENSPVAVAEETQNETAKFRTLASLFVEYQILKGLTAKSSLNLDHMDNQRDYFMPSTVRGTVATRMSSPGLNATGLFSGFRAQNFLNENTLSYNTEIADKHNISVVAGTSFNSIRRMSWSISSNGGYVNDIVQTLNNANGISPSSNTYKTKNVLMSIFSRVQYNLSDKYLVSASVRRDASSRFGKNTKWGVFPAASIGWRVSKENFMPDLAWLNDLKLRASWGISGNDGFGDFEDVATLSLANYAYGNTKAPGLVPANVSNPNLGWEISEMIDIGTDMALFNNRMHLTYDYYTKKNSDLLLSIPIPASTGFSTAATNIGEVQNWGWELEIAGKILTKSELKWNASLNLSHNSNEVKKLGPDNSPILGGAYTGTHNILTIGEPMYSLYVVKMIGILSQEDIDNGAAMLNTEQVGDPKYYDANDDGKITEDDRMIVGHPNPDYTWGISSELKYKGFDLSMTVQGQWGGKLYSVLGRGVDGPGWEYFYNQLGANRDRWKSPEDPGAGLRSKAYSTFGRVQNTDWMYPNDYWRIRNITLGYDLGKYFRNSLIHGMRIYTSLENYFGGDKYYGGVNPEAVTNSGEDYGAYPLSKSIVFGLNVTF